jgi:hypothetical protein
MKLVPGGSVFVNFTGIVKDGGVMEWLPPSSSACGFGVREEALPRSPSNEWNWGSSWSREDVPTEEEKKRSDFCLVPLETGAHDSICSSICLPEHAYPAVGL